MSDPFRKVVRCEHCRLNQFAVEGGICRRCKQPVIKAEIVASTHADFRMPHGLVDFAFAIKLLREANGISQAGLARLIRVARTYISKIERRNVTPHIANVYRIAAALGVPATVLITIATTPRVDPPQELSTDATQTTERMSLRTKDYRENVSGVQA
jgi:transcriptional regulator with XRE-family HTH domain